MANTPKNKIYKIKKRHWVSVNELVEYYDVTPPVIYNMVHVMEKSDIYRDGVRKLGEKCIRVDPDAFDAFVASRNY